MNKRSSNCTYIMPLQDVMWVAGYLEGEGSFFLRKTPKGSWVAVVRAGSTDYDVLIKVQSLTLMGFVNGPYKWKSTTKPMWQWMVQKDSNALHLMRQVYPHMGDRRQKKIEEILNERP